MKPANSFEEIGDLLRSQAPSCPPPAGLEARILLALDQRRHPAPRIWWPWLLLPPAFAAIVVLMWPKPTVPALETTRNEIPLASDPALESVVSVVDAENPLAAETDALSRDALRAGSFLIDCLPSVAFQSE